MRERGFGKLQKRMRRFGDSVGLFIREKGEELNSAVESG